MTDSNISHHSNTPQFPILRRLAEYINELELGRERAVYYLRESNNKTWEDIGEILGISREWARVMHKRAKQKREAENE